MKKLLFILSLCFCLPLYAELPTTIEPTPFALPVPEPTSPAIVEPLIENFELNTTLDALWGPKKIRFENIKDLPQSFPVLCELAIHKSLCQANFMQVNTDTGGFMKNPIARSVPISYIAISNFNNYFDLQIRGNTACAVDISCKYLVQ